MTETPRDDKPKPARRPRIKLPFDNRREDMGSWTYDHRIGLCVTLIAYLALMIVFVSSKIVVGRRTHQQGMYIDLQTLAEMEQERDRLEREVRERQRQEEIDWRSIRNQASNENALNEKLRDDRGTNAAALNQAAAEAEARMQANREAYEQGLAEERAIRERRGKEDGAERQDRKVKGRVTVSFSITDPVRTSRYLEVPAYLCEGGGDVTVSVTVDRAGKVTGARHRGRRRLHARVGSARRPQFVVQHRQLGARPSDGNHHLYLHSPMISDDCGLPAAHPGAYPIRSDGASRALSVRNFAACWPAVNRGRKPQKTFYGKKKTFFGAALCRENRLFLWIISASAADLSEKNVTL